MAGRKEKYLVQYTAKDGPLFAEVAHDEPYKAQEIRRQFNRSGMPARIIRVSVDEAGDPVAEWVEWPDNGLYRIYWTKEAGGGTSLAAVGITGDGGRWLACTNWSRPVDPYTTWDHIEHFERVVEGYE